MPRYGHRYRSPVPHIFHLVYQVGEGVTSQQGWSSQLPTRHSLKSPGQEASFQSCKGRTPGCRVLPLPARHCWISLWCHGFFWGYWLAWAERLWPKSCLASLPLLSSLVERADFSWDLFVCACWYFQFADFFSFKSGSLRQKETQGVHHYVVPWLLRSLPALPPPLRLLVSFVSFTYIMSKSFSCT